MRRLLSIMIILIVTFAMMIQDADARRFGGGRSFGMQRSASSFSRPQPAAAPFAARQPSTASKWLGPLAGLAAGGLIASLLMGHGLGSGILSWIIVLGIAFILWNLFRGRRQMATAPRFQPEREGRIFDQNANFTSQQNYQASHHTVTHPAGFDAEDFLRNAKVQFIRLQAAYDSKNLTDIREFTAPEVFGEIQLQIQERGQETNHTEVVSLNAEILDIATEFQATVVTVKFSGMIRENEHEAAAAFQEIWHFQKDTYSSKWLVAGVQQ